MIFHMSVCSSPVLRKTNLAVWRAWRSWKLSWHSSTVCASSGPGPLDRSEKLSAVSTEKPPHTPVMLKEVLHYLDIQPGQVCLHFCYLCKMSIRKLMSVFSKCSFKYDKDSFRQVSAKWKYSNKSNSVIVLRSYYHYCHYNIFTLWCITTLKNSLNVFRL